VRPHSTRIGGVNSIFLPAKFSLATSSDYLDFARQADSALFAISSEAELDGCAALIDSFKRFGIFFIIPGSEARIVRSSMRGINVIGSSSFLDQEEAIEYLSRMNLNGVTVELSKFSTKYSLDAATERNPVLLRFWILLEEQPYSHYKEEVMLLSHSIPANIKRLSEVMGDPMNLLLDVLIAIRRIRIWTKEPGGKTISEDPVLLRDGATVLDLARAIHGELATELKYAIVHRPSENMRLVRVGSGFQLRDGDIVEIH